MKNYCLYLCCLFFFTNIKAQTNVSGGIYGNAHWTVANSPYIVTDTLVLFPGGALTIDPGVVVKCDANVWIDIRGVLNATGDINDSIQFIPNTSAQTYNFWKGLHFNADTTAQVHLKYAKISGAECGIYVGYISAGGGYGGPFKISRVSLVFNKTGVSGVSTWAGVATIDSCHFINNMYGIGDGGSCGNLNPTNCLFKDNMYGVNFVSNCNFSYCTFICNNIAIYINSGTHTNCIIENNGVGIKPFGQSSLTLSGCIISKNDTGIILNQYTNDVIHNNTICNNHYYNVVHSGNYSEDMSNNCWCDTVKAHIEQKIYDGYDNINLGIISVTPYTICDSSLLPASSICNIFNPTVGIRNIDYTTNQVLLYPNPTSTNFTLETNSTEKQTLQIFDVNGKLVLSQIIYGKINIDATNLAEGIYNLSLINASSVINKRLVIIK